MPKKKKSSSGGSKSGEEFSESADFNKSSSSNNASGLKKKRRSKIDKKLLPSTASLTSKKSNKTSREAPKKRRSFLGGAFAKMRSKKSDASVEDDLAESAVSYLPGGDKPPPIGIIDASDAELVSEMGGSRVEDEDEERAIVPKDSDVCFNHPERPAIEKWKQLIRELLRPGNKFADTPYSPPVYKAIKKKLKGKRFLVYSVGIWREASKPEIIEFFGEYFTHQQQQRIENEARSKNLVVVVDANDDEEDDELNDTAKYANDDINPQDQENSEASLSVGDLMQDPPLQSKRQSKQHSQQQQQPDDVATESQQTPISISPTQSAEYVADGMLQACIAECQRAHELAIPYDDATKVQQGILADRKLQLLSNVLTSKHAASSAELRRQFQSLQELAKRIQIANMAVLLEPLECMGEYLQDYFTTLTETANSPSLEASLRRIQADLENDDGDDSASLQGTNNAKRSGKSKRSSKANNKAARSTSAALHDDSNNKLEKSNNSIVDKQRQPPRWNPSGFSTGTDTDDNDESYEEISVAPKKNGQRSVDPDGAQEQHEDSLVDINDMDGDDQEQESKTTPDASSLRGNNGSYGEMVEEGSFDMDNQGTFLSKFNSKSGGNLDDAHVLEVDKDSMDDDMSSVGRSTRGFDFGSQGFNYKDDDDDEGRYEHATSSDDEEDFEEVVVEDEDGDEEDASMNDSSGSSSSSSSSSSQDKHEKKSERNGPVLSTNPRVEQFFVRLQHFFEVRRKVEERAELMDPSAKIKNLKLKLHSGGISKGRGRYKKEYQQHDLMDRVVRSFDDLYESAQEAHPAMRKILDQLAAEVKGLDITACSLATMKPRDRAYEKAKSEYSDRKPGPAESWLYDIVRCSVMCKSSKQMSDVNKWLGKKVHIVNSKNRFAVPAFNGYRDFLYHVSIPYQDELAHICEIQVHHKDMKALDEQFGLPKHLEFFRSAFAHGSRSEEETLTDLKLLNKYGTMEGPLLAKVMRSKDCQQLNLFADICRNKLDEFDRALEIYRRLLMMQEDTLGRDHVDVANTYLNIGLVLGMMGETDESLLNLQKALTIKEKALGAEHLQVAESHGQIGQMLSKKGDFDGALEEHRKALELRKSLLGADHFMVIGSFQDIGHAFRDQGDYRAAVGEYEKALRIQAEVLGPQHTDVAATHAMIGTALCLQGEYDRAMDEHMRALDIREAGMGKNHPMTAESHTDIGIVQFHKGDYEVAEWRHKKALRIREAILGKDHEECAKSYSRLGEVLSKKGEYSKALKEVRRGLAIREATLGRDHPLTACSYIDIGNIHFVKGEYDDSLYEYRRAVVIRESILGDKHPQTAVAYNAMAKALVKKGEYDLALTRNHKAVDIFENVLGRSHPMTASGYECIAHAMMANGDRDEALAEHRKALAVRANVLSKDHPDTAASCSNIGTLLLDKGDIVGAMVAFGQALAIQNALSGDDHPDTAIAQLNIGRVHAMKKDFSEALEAMHIAVTIQETSFGKDHPQTAFAYSLLGSVHSMMGKFSQAKSDHQTALKIREAYFGKKDPRTLLSKSKVQMATKEEKETEMEPSSSQ